MLSLCMIVKNEIKVLEKCITSVKKELEGVVNDLIVIDTGSTDGTKELAESLGCKVFDFEWVNDFSKARNFSVSKAKNDWILFLDADEYITKVDKNELKKLCVKKFDDVKGYIKMQNIDANNQIISSTKIPRIFNRKIYHFENIVHETIYRIKPGKTTRYYLSFEVEHTGYIKEIFDEKDKANRNKKLLLEHLEKDPDNLYMLGQLAIMYKAEGDFDKAIEVFEKVIFNEDSIDTDYYIMMVCEYLKLLLHLNYNEAAMVCINLWNYCKSSDEYMHYMGLACLRLGHIEKGIEILLEAANKEVDREIDAIFTYFALATTFDQIGMLEEALKYYYKCGNQPEVLGKIKEIEQKIAEI